MSDTARLSTAPQRTQLSATSAALLGQLAWREQTTYELVKAMGADLRFFWPRAESHVYREVKRLVALGLASTQRGATGRRARTIYRATDAGREALSSWLATPSSGFALEHEPLLRVFLASNGTREDLLDALSAARAQADAMHDVGRELADVLLAGTHPFQDEMHIRALTFDYLWSWATLTQEWATRAETEVNKWRDLRPARAKQRRAREHLIRLVGRKR